MVVWKRLSRASGSSPSRRVTCGQVCFPPIVGQLWDGRRGRGDARRMVKYSTELAVCQLSERSAVSG